MAENRVRRIATAIWQRPWALLAIGAAAAALAFPRVAAGHVGIVFLAGLAGCGIVRAWPRLAGRLQVSSRTAGYLAIAVVVLAAVIVFRHAFDPSLSFIRGDWGPQHAVLRGVVDHLRNFELPHWNQRISTGDAPLDVYPALTYVLAGALALVTGLDDSLPIVLFGMGVLVHTLIAVCGTRLALRFVSAPIAAAVGLLLLIDMGSVSSGGIMGTLMWGLLHTAVGQLFALLATIAIVDAVRRPHLATSVRIWLWTALATAAHPSSLLAMACAAAALLAIALLARDVPPRRALIALVHLAIGTALAAVVWLPLGERIVLYAQHFSDTLADPGHFFLTLLREPIPVGSFAAVVYAGYAGALAALWSRRAVPIFVAATVIVMVIALVDAPYLAFDIAPSKSVARLGAMRFYGLVRPFVFLAAAYLASLLFGLARSWWRGADRRSVRTAAFVAGVLGLAALRFGCQTTEMIVAQGQKVAPDRWDLQTFAAWAREQMVTIGPDHWGRALFIDTNAYYAHVTAQTGLPAFHSGPIPSVLLRERFEDVGAESLRRFNVRWVITQNPSFGIDIGDPSTDRQVAGFLVRDIAGWDGQFARIESGAGQVKVTRLDDDAVDVELTGTTAPALVALGTGYYPRWRATGPGGTALPVYAYPATPGGHRYVPAAWLPPGTTRFTPDGPLPSDGDGRLLSLAALAAALAIITIWSRPRMRYWLLRRLARAARWRPRHLAPLAVAAVLGLLAWGAFASLAPARALEVGTGAWASAKVSIKHRDEPWSKCSYSHALAEFHCGDAIVTDTTATIVNDGQILWPFTTPAIGIFPSGRKPYLVRVTVTRRLAGRYWIGSIDRPVTVDIAGMEPFKTDQQRVVELADREYKISITTQLTDTPVWVTFVREDTLEPERRLPVAPSQPP